MDYKHDVLDICYVCSFKFTDFLAWDEDGEHPQYGEFCPSCGTEFGYEDATLDALKNKRAEWVSNGMRWWNADEKLAKMPQYWNPQIQLLNIPKKYI